MKLILKFVALFVYPLIDKKNNPVFGVADATDFSYSNIAIRNSCHNFMARPMVKYTQTGNKLAEFDWSLEEVNGFQWRIRRSKAMPGIEAGAYKSIRMTWGKANSDGKDEFYFGWTMDDKRKVMRPTLQLRPF